MVWRVSARFTPLRVEGVGLTVRRGLRVLFRDLDLHVGPGGFAEIVGPNGAGKTTLLRALAGLAPLEGGEVRVFASKGRLDPDAQAGAAHLLGHRDGLKPGLDAAAHLRFWAGLLEGEEALIPRALERVGLKLIADLPARGLSAGQGRRLALARLLVAPRPIWLLDEPAAALDRAGKALLVNLVDEHRAQGGLVIAAVHEPLGAKPSATIRIGAER